MLETVNKFNVEYISVFEDLVFEITSRILRILMERIKIKIA